MRFLSQSLGHNVVAVIPRPRLPGRGRIPKRGWPLIPVNPRSPPNPEVQGTACGPQIEKDNVEIGGGSPVAPSTNERWEHPVPVASVSVGYVTNDECDPLPLLRLQVQRPGVMKYTVEIVFTPFVSIAKVVTKMSVCLEVTF